MSNITLYFIPLTLCFGLLYAWGVPAVAKTVELGEHCDSSLKVFCPNYMTCDYSTKVCVCSENFFPHDKTCLRKHKSLNATQCMTDSHCSSLFGSNTKCIFSPVWITGFCDCSAGFAVDINLSSCIPVVNDLGGECINSNQCRNGQLDEFSECKENVCVCARFSVHNRETRKCEEVAESECSNDTDCAALEKRSICKRGQCLCKFGTLTNSKPRRCNLRATKIGDECEDQSECSKGVPGLLSDCINGKCQCNEISVPSHDGIQCLRIAELVHAFCKEDIQCTSGLGNTTFCYQEGRRCDCVSGTTINKNKTMCIKNPCSGKQRIGDQCTHSEDCGGIAVCTKEGICTCPDGTIHSRMLSDCYPIRRKLGAECKETQQCQHQFNITLADCVDGKCACSQIAVLHGERCHQKANVVGDKCNSDMQCISNLGAAYCDGRMCHCLPNTLPSSDNSTCIVQGTDNEDSETCSG